METTLKIRELFDKANEQITQIRAWIMEHEDAFQYMDLKLHDVSFWCGGKEMQEKYPLCYEKDFGKYEYSYFYIFCEDEYRLFLEDLKENFGIDFKDFHYQLGRTSSFYLHDQSIIQLRSHKIDMGDTMEGIMNNLYGWNNWIFYNDNGTINEEKTLSGYEDYISSEEEILEHIENELDFIINEAYNELVKEMKNVLVVYDYIHNFKENQVEYFKEWLQYYEDELAEEKRKEEEYEAKRQNLIARFENPVLREILNKYVHNNDAIENLLQTV